MHLRMVFPNGGCEYLPRGVTIHSGVVICARGRWEYPPQGLIVHPGWCVILVEGVVMSCMRVCRKQALSRVKYYNYVTNSKIQQATIMTVIMTK